MFSTASSATGAGWSTLPVEPKPDAGAGQPRPFRLTRRTLLASTAALSVVATFPTLATAAIDRGEPFDDGTFFDDGYGWVD